MINEIRGESQTPKGDYRVECQLLTKKRETIVNERVFCFAPRKSSRQNHLCRTIKVGKRVTKKPSISLTLQTPKESTQQSQPSRQKDDPLTRKLEESA